MTTRQVWVLLAVAESRIDFDPSLPELPCYTVDGRAAQWPLTVLALRGLIMFNPWLPGPPRLTRAGTAALRTR
ncbi:MAG TPA: hypothetical protein VFP34_05075 [Microlunatus sp.]|nr:hypothetical protein [Microlunatus sp.]